MSILFNKIENGNIFTHDFSPFVQNNEIKFSSSEGIAVIYGPNGTGKTSLIKVLSDNKGTKVGYSYEDTEYTAGKDVFYIINDQNNRNIIAGETKDFFLGDNIRREFELQETVLLDRNNLITSIINIMKNSYGISSASNPLLNTLTNAKICAFIKDCVNNKSKGKKFSNDDLASLMGTLKKIAVPKYEQDKLNYLIIDLSKENSIINQLENILGKTINANSNVREIEENTEAISILNKYHKNKCIVCDTNGIDWKNLLTSKTTKRETALNSLDEYIRDIIENLISKIQQDPFDIKENLLSAVENGDMCFLVDLFKEINLYKKIIEILIYNSICELSSSSSYLLNYIEYKKILDETPDISDEDYLYIKEIISNSMNKPLSIVRDENNRLRIYLSNQEFLGKERNELPLSTGEQNFLSLTFEFLKAKNSNCPIVVIDDPVSSFDSIYKNKVVYAIAKILHHKKRIVLTHNTDLIRLLEGQYPKCFKLYLLNNTEGETNGFIPFNIHEQQMLISLEKLLQAFRDDIPKHIKEPNLFLISMIPFMRGYANIIHKTNLVESLTQVMHGYNNGQVDIGAAYQELFGTHTGFLPSSYIIKVDDILAQTVDGKHLVDMLKYPILDRTLRHSFTYLFLRLVVEKNLVLKFNIDTNINKKLGQIISAAYPDEKDITQIRNRIRLTSKKTLINEFNHFEGNLSIFQPAIDITDQALGKERTDIIAFIASL